MNLIERLGPYDDCFLAHRFVVGNRDGAAYRGTGCNDIGRDCHKEKDHFTGWPANNGIWCWENENRCKCRKVAEVASSLEYHKL